MLHVTIYDAAGDTVEWPSYPAGYGASLFVTRSSVTVDWVVSAGPFQGSFATVTRIGKFDYSTDIFGSRKINGGHFDREVVRIDDQLHIALAYDQDIDWDHIESGFRRNFRDGVDFEGNDHDNQFTAGPGRDVMLGNRGNDSLRGRAGDDLLVGHAGDDVLNGGTGRDEMIGGRGDDVFWIDSRADQMTERRDAGHDTAISTVSLASLARNVEDVRLRGDGDLNAVGNGLANKLVGNAGDNRLAGGGGADVIEGGGGRDVLVGGAGRDLLVGGDGGDRFRFTATADSPGGARSDVIGDFESRLDRIDLRAIDADTGRRGDQAFLFIGPDGFSGAAGELRYGSDGRLRGDVDGDGLADLVVELAGAPALVPRDLLL